MFQKEQTTMLGLVVNIAVKCSFPSVRIGKLKIIIKALEA